MSFNDLERGEVSQPLIRSAVGGQIAPVTIECILIAENDNTFTSIKDSVSIQIFKVQSNVQGIQRLVDKLGGQADGPALRTSL